MEERSLFDEKARHYDEWYQTPLGELVDRIEKEAVYSYLESREGESILEIGCGTGNYALDLAARGVKVTAVDISPAMLERAREKARASGLEVELLLADARRLPFPHCSFDKVLAVTLLEFVPQPEKALEEAYRVLKIGGRLVVGAIAEDSPWARFYREKAQHNPSSVFRKARFFTLEELLALLPGKEKMARTVLSFGPEFTGPRGEALEMEKSAQEGSFIVAVSYKI